MTVDPQTQAVDFQKRRPIRQFLNWLAYPAFKLLTNLTIEGEENLPESGPLIIVANHFSFVDPTTLVRVSPWLIDFVGGDQFPHAPGILKIIPILWGYLPLKRGTGSTFALKQAEKIIDEGGIIAIFPEGGNWAEVLRPARPGAAFLANRTKAKILPIGIEGATKIFPSLARFRRAKLTIRIGESFGPFEVTKTGKGRREELDEIGHEIMRRIAVLLPPESRGHYSDDPAVREAAAGTELWPWADKVEGEVTGQIR
ncbi:MAG: 1-acyl-sn-glycerol-3-phosphate acyltransferase [Chloroflexi bacterium]|nr:1-acyl-sn-glycerol-3-phosphate acyltransferase [Chloroflexota bacterium]MBT3671289.1 1-acyl-sn-glycerol-3-phosphate acyltransferase [Chloroflexota bacterium]MBT4001768.1 1-acyl-sn-glycerol-3-phosphate acyltransferase [Chloroflexota bacterium]MBT4534271.1 1-acyl-sn-glycerol-3-phosphate acyltransferase [Chloroflexota bacterium]MBT4682454.1 1-acyl-sn-glycerol-3-phosphate acyltransferase [Chloroflexota bacterium]